LDLLDLLRLLIDVAHPVGCHLGGHLVLLGSLLSLVDRPGRFLSLGGRLRGTRPSLFPTPTAAAAFATGPRLALTGLHFPGSLRIALVGLVALLGVQFGRLRDEYGLALGDFLGDRLVLVRRRLLRRGSRRGRAGGLVEPEFSGQFVPGVIILSAWVGHIGWPVGVYDGRRERRTASGHDSITPEPARTQTPVRPSRPAARVEPRPRSPGPRARPRTRRRGLPRPVRPRAGRHGERGTRPPATRQPTPADRRSHPRCRRGAGGPAGSGRGVRPGHRRALPAGGEDRSWPSWAPEGWGEPREYRPG